MLSVLDGHDDNVCSLSWCPVDFVTEDSKLPGQPLFASATSECVAVWNSTERQCIKSFGLPK